MIPLRLAVEPGSLATTSVVRVNSHYGLNTSRHDAHLVSVDDDGCTYEGTPGSFRLSGVDPVEADGDVLLIVPERKVALRLIRARSDHNTLLVTEQCDQLCLMCSQPPKPHHVDLFADFETACLLAPHEAVIGISGGEPTLHKDRLFRMLSNVHAARPDLSFHVLTNAQHFIDIDSAWLRHPAAGAVTWGVPLYSTHANLHDHIVGKQGAHARLLESLALLGRAGAAVELRTVIMTENAPDLPRLAAFVTTHVPFVVRWAIMQLENIGYARRDWDRLFFDSSVDFDPVAEALNIAKARGVAATLYNFPLCTVPEAYRASAPSTISDWKRKYLARCAACTARSVCGGFFEWYPEGRGFRHVVPQ